MQVSRRSFLKSGVAVAVSTLIPLKMFLSVNDSRYKVEYQGLYSEKGYRYHKYRITKQIDGRTLQAFSKIDKALVDVVPDKKRFVEQEIKCHIHGMKLFEANHRKSKRGVSA